MSEPEDTQPVFPPEIEEIIFSLCLHNELEDSKNVVLVAKRVYEWMKPQLYKVAIVHYDKTYYGRPKITSELLKIHGHLIRHILHWITTSDSEACFQQPATCLSLCSNVVDIALWDAETIYDEVLIDRLLALRLTHLSFDVTRFHLGLTKCSITKRVAFIFITHLDLQGMAVGVQVGVMKGYFPSLTHMALNEERKLPAQAILDCWGNQLEVLIWYINTSSGHSTDSLPKDLRVVVIDQSCEYVHDWHEATKGGPSSVWRRAEGEVKRRRADGI
ncbi:hypothetical protein BDN72DRAFT_959571 [Pluteus cervinus]|uniref:Uncharacterized protein n=1 Tax=Pluteus cervinus TaxID=181527 RepID=A0ACD3AWZ2_9AGAR|nr:hypothetical protein BDN72DRAFT_959571 [Pluteus cervinus]